jgi:chitinase
VDTQIEIDGSQGAVRACAILKQQRPYLKLIFSVGGADGSKENFALAAADAQKRATFGYTSRQLVDQYNFDGIDSASLRDTGVQRLTWAS